MSENLNGSQINSELEELTQSIEDELYNARMFNNDLESEITELRIELERLIAEIKMNYK